MRQALLLILVLVSFQSLHAQKGLTGLWTGTLSNDSSTIRKDQAFEIALTQYREKVYGYTRSSFIVNDTLFYIVKRVKGKVQGNVCEVTDDEILSYNFSGRLDKGIKVTYTFRMNEADSTWQLDGDWKTNKTKQYYSISGKAELKEEKNLDNSKIFPHLEELKLDADVPFYAATKAPVKTEIPPVTAAAKEVKKEERKDPPKTKEEKEEPIADRKKGKKNEKITQADITVGKNTSQQTAMVPNGNSKEDAVTNNTEKISGPSLTKQEVAPVVLTTQERVLTRTTAAPQIVQFRSDSLLLSLYDNGEVDGDTVSVLLNGVVIMDKQELKATAIKKTIQIPADQDELILLLFAENLGRYPPNTGLLVVRDGQDVYQVRFTADLNQNASIIFRRKKQ